MSWVPPPIDLAKNVGLTLPSGRGSVEKASAQALINRASARGREVLLPSARVSSGASLPQPVAPASGAAYGRQAHRRDRCARESSGSPQVAVMPSMRGISVAVIATSAKAFDDWTIRRNVPTLQSTTPSVARKAASMSLQVSSPASAPRIIASRHYKHPNRHVTLCISVPGGTNLTQVRRLVSLIGSPLQD